MTPATPATPPPADTRPDAHPRTQVMGILNVTTDSFSDGGRFTDSSSDLIDAASVAHAVADMLDAGADIIDIGAESTRPGAARVDAATERARILAAIEAIAASSLATPPPVSIDTMRATVADAALESGASIINDVSGGTADPDMLRVIAGSDSRVVLMHWPGGPAHGSATYQHLGNTAEEVYATVLDTLRRRVDAALAAGVSTEQIILDPGLGFATSPADSLTLLGRTADLHRDTGLPILIGASRKRFLRGYLPATPTTSPSLADATPAEPDSWAALDSLTTASSVYAATAGAWAVRVHDVASTASALRLVHDLTRTHSHNPTPSAKDPHPHG